MGRARAIDQPAPVPAYGSQAYVNALREFGSPLQLPKCGGWILKRVIEDGAEDAIGPYPLFSCTDWRCLQSDLEDLAGHLVSITLVLDPFGPLCEDDLRKCFPDRCIAFKNHFIVDLSSQWTAAVESHHLRNSKKGLAQLNVELCDNPLEQLDEWCRLYDNLIRRHHIHGIRAFSRRSFEEQLTIKGTRVFRASRGNDVIGMTVWYEDRDVAYYHLGAYSELGYQLRASFAIFYTALHHFASTNVLFANLGAGAGLGEMDDGLSRFKRGWASGVRTAYLGGRVLDVEAYRVLVNARNKSAAKYFPAYREGEFT